MDIQYLHKEHALTLKLTLIIVAHSVMFAPPHILVALRVYAATYLHYNLLRQFLFLVGMVQLTLMTIFIHLTYL